jgi:hypothetical protein
MKYCSDKNLWTGFANIPEKNLKQVYNTAERHFVGKKSKCKSN